MFLKIKKIRLERFDTLFLNIQKVRRFKHIRELLVCQPLTFGSLKSLHVLNTVEKMRFQIFGFQRILVCRLISSFHTSLKEIPVLNFNKKVIYQLKSLKRLRFYKDSANNLYRLAGKIRDLEEVHIISRDQFPDIFNMNISAFFKSHRY